MTHDPVASGKTIWKGRAFNAPALIVLALVFAGSYFMFLREFAYQNADLYIHAMIAHDFDFTDLHSITSRLSYPVWHIVVSALYQLGVPLGHAAAGVIARFHRHPATQIIQRDLVQIGHAAQLEQVQTCREIRAIRFERIR